ncbi:hypothetical protein [Nocardia cyriacigeorgica]|uniref:hypothetical protein n=1 Tax=Nocardia cyriacigeorgica TaxID=135487 RepID=UPI0018963D44|nr:hypothetical protein [Nocardia cyriacigeorgica]MBF6161398.1 hypothetical protein [Nocardia cyriacigeorgica]MBF6200177.1 hypothetical protein [Nocardia cyriacigeorgica]
MAEIPTEKPRIKDGENPDHLDHSQINDSFTPLNTTEAFSAANKFTEIENKWTDGVRAFAARIQRSSSAAWEGPAAESARAALSNYTTRAQDLSPVMQALANRVYGAVDSINTTKRELPEVVEKRPAWNPTSWPYVGSHSASKRDDAEATAREVMGTHYVKPFVKADSEIPVLPKPDDPTQPLVPPVKPPTEGREWEGGGGDTGGGDGGGDGSGGGDQGGSGDQGGTEGETEENTGTEETGGETTEGQQDPTTTAANTTTPASTPASSTSRLMEPSFTSTTPAGMNPAGYSPTGVPGGRPGGSTGTGGMGRGGGAGAGSGSGGSGSGGEKPGAGRSIPGGPGGLAAQTGAGAAAAARAAAAGRGMMGMPMGGMAPGAGRGGNAEENEHKTPDYLITAENTDELLGEVPKTVAGGVIGGDVPSAAPVREQDGEGSR